MPLDAIDLGTKAAIVGAAIAIVLVIRAIERNAPTRARKRTRRALDRTLSQ